VVEAGPNAFMARANEPEPHALVRELGLESVQIAASRAASRRFVWRRGRLRAAPGSPLALLTSDALSLAGRLRVAAEPFVRRGGEPHESVHAFAARRIGREAADALVDPAVAGISAGDSHELEAAAAFPAMVEMERAHGSLARAMLARRTQPPRLVSLAPGMGAIPDALCRRLAGAVRTGARVVRVARAGRVWQLLLESGERLEADAVVVATAAAEAAAALAVLDPELADVLASFPRAGLGVVALAFRENVLPHPLDGYGFLVARDAGLDTLGVVWESSLFAQRAPAGHVLLRVMLGGARRPGIAGLPSAELLARARADLATTMRISAAPLRHWIWHWPDAITQYTPGHLDRVARARARLARHPGLELCGTSYDGVSFTAGILSAERAAARLLASPPLRLAGPTRRDAPAFHAPPLQLRSRAFAPEDRPMRRHIILITYGEPPTPAFTDQLRYSWRILLGLTRLVAPIPRPLLPLIALSRARTRNRLWSDERYVSPLEPVTSRQAHGVADVLRRDDPDREWHVHVAYEFRDPSLAHVLDHLPADEPAEILPMYVADSAFTHEISRDTVRDWALRGGAGRAAHVRVLPALDEELLAELSARHVERALEARRLGGRDWALVLAAHGTLLEPPRPMETGRAATERLCAAIERRLAGRFGGVFSGWLNHTRGGRWTEPAMDETLRRVAAARFERVVYFPYGFLADNAESELEGRVFLRAHAWRSVVHLPCLNTEPGLVAALARHALAPRPDEAHALAGT